MKEIELRTGAWYNDRSIQLTFPDSWDVVTYWPDTPSPLTDEEIAEQIRRPIGQPTLSELARGKKRPVIVVDDLARPTPVFRILPFLLKEFEAAGIQSHDVRILVATGTHGHQDASALASKIGQPAYARCQVIVHSDLRGTKFIGTTSPFPDLRSDLPYFNAVMTVTSRGIMGPLDMTSGEFAPLKPLPGVDALLIIRKMKEELKFF